MPSQKTIKKYKWVIQTNKIENKKLRIQQPSSLMFPSLLRKLSIVCTVDPESINKSCCVTHWDLRNGMKKASQLLQLMSQSDD